MDGARNRATAVDGRLALVLGAAAWLAVQLAFWPAALSFGDEVGYLGQVRVLLSGHVRPNPTDPGVWFPGDHGLVGKYPLFLPLVVAPLFAIDPRVTFAVGVGAALALTFLAARILRTWGRSPVWALVVLAHPTVVIIARTVMVDLLLSALAVGAWYALACRRLVTAAALFALIVVAKPTGILIALALAAGDLASFRGTSIDARARLVRSGGIAGGIAAGVVATAILNYVATGSLWYGYARQNVGASLFSPGHISHALPVHVMGLLLCPPLLILGMVPLWRRRALGPLLVVVTLVAAMGCYFFVDRGRSPVETLVLAPRLILPAVAMLLIGYADLLSGLAARLGRRERFLGPVVAAVPALVCLVLAGRHHGWQKPQAAALATAQSLAAQQASPELGLSGEAFKAGMLFRGRTISVGIDGSPRPAVVLCGATSASYREPVGSFRCQRPDYEDRPLAAGFHLLVRR